LYENLNEKKAILDSLLHSAEGNFFMHILEFERRFENGK